MIWRRNALLTIQEKNLLMWTLKKTLSLRTQRGPYHWEPLESSVNEKPEEDIVTVTPIANLINENPLELQDSQWPLHRKLTLFGFSAIVYNRVGDEDKISRETFDLWRHRFHATSHLKIDAKEFFMWTMNTT